jgi:phosphohistidine phosphatase
MESSANDAATQRRLILIRHAKAVEEDIGGDHARKLSARGQADAAALAAWLHNQGLVADLALCSTAVRTRETLAALGARIPTQLCDTLYLATPDEMLAHLQQCDDAVGTLMVVAHNPGTHALLALLIASYAREADAERVALKFPTSACAVLTLPVRHWREVTLGSAHLLLLRE